MAWGRCYSFTIAASLWMNNLYYFLTVCLFYISCSCFPALFSKCLKETLFIQGMYITSQFASFQVRSTDEVLNNLSVEVHQNTSITHCLRCFFSTETISAENKVQCENCCSLQEHQVRMLQLNEEWSSPGATFGQCLECAAIWKRPEMFYGMIVERIINSDVIPISRPTWHHLI